MPGTGGWRCGCRTLPTYGPMLTDMGPPGMNARQFTDAAREHGPGLDASDAPGCFGPWHGLEAGKALTGEPCAPACLAINLCPIVGSGRDSARASFRSRMC